VTALSAIFSLIGGKKKIPGAVDRIFFGIGNPGLRYKNTRHNVGFAAIDRMSRTLEAVSRYRIDGGNVIVGRRDGFICALVKPMTYVNQCGAALRACIEKTRCPLESCLVIVDDYHLPLGTLRLKRGGSDGGHNGLKSIIEHVGTDFPRLRIGIGPLPGLVGAMEFVLGRFTAQETALLKNTFQKAEEAMVAFALQGIDAAMNAFNNTLKGANMSKGHTK
jgi:peptidyl-tRNA hydrolase, PTH1 family